MRIDRRRFLLGAGGAALALPMLQALQPREARTADGAVAPKRLIIVHHYHGRMTGGDPDHTGGSPKVADNWSPRSNTGPLPETGDISPLLAALAPVRNEIVTIDGVDNLVRHMTGDPDGHLSANLTGLTCAPPTADMSPGGPSFDYAAGLLLRSSSSQRASIIFPASVADTDEHYFKYPFFGADGTPAYATPTHPAEALLEVFGPPEPTEPMPTKTLRDRLIARRGSILDGVAGEYTALSKRMTGADRTKLEQHAQFIRDVESHLNNTFGIECTRPSEDAIPAFDRIDNLHGAIDPLVTPWQIENLVMALACDVTRVGVLHFWQSSEQATFASEFGGQSPIADDQLHARIHESTVPESETAGYIRQGFQEIGKLYTKLIQRLAEVTDVDGARLLDNTLVVWTSELGYGSHLNFDIPIVLAGLPSAFPSGQGRHIVPGKRHTTGDVYSQALAMLGLPDATFGYQGKVGDLGASGDALMQYAGYGGSTGTPYVQANLPLHTGPIDL